MRKQYVISIKEKTNISCYEDETLLNALYRNNMQDIVFGCFGGGCGRCLIRVEKGVYEIIRRMSKEHINKESDDKLLACCVQPRSNMEISIL
ncbi:ferredoxin [Breznakia sp. PF5-3]|uniref:2Fe-2S iron-sulfur cluster-binding protein n=1 Tax=unclassified Breznakia TaxID=2623764 RepID=UPI0024062D65|nr:MULTISPECIES: 2Fe-2S iron-sulfur cluster-binding protein [unclassified Breznakia]MDF9825041.1 ferredoxin [Breznakia sp. PM6-1]MDF9835888.1 ferredoxin [Breznakia sp. PF5-3]MDL2276213.1 2Fe-2S iron-sulfur cluster binding domain-containing protein [Breznakia sp. OttesenSCG-928-G09]